jgi:hypothetical protein
MSGKKCFAPAIDSSSREMVVDSDIEYVRASREFAGKARRPGGKGFAAAG